MSNMKMPAWLEKARDESSLKHEHEFGKSNRSFEMGFQTAFELMSAERDMLRAALKASVHNECIDGHFVFKCKCPRCEALEKSDRYETPAQNEEK